MCCSLENPIFGIIFLYPWLIIFPELLLIVYTFPVIYFNSKVNPHSASFTLIVFSKIRSKPLLLNSVSFSTFINNFISPLQSSLAILPLSRNTIISPSSPREFSVSPFRHKTTTFFPSFLYIDRLFFSKDRSWLKPLLLRTWKHKSALNLHILLFHCYKNFSDFQDIKLRSALNRHILLLHYYKEFWDFQGTFMLNSNFFPFSLYMYNLVIRIHFNNLT